MKLSSQGIVNGVIHDRYGKRGPMNEYEMPTVSLPLKIEDAPANTVSYALVLEDKDAFQSVVSHGFIGQLPILQKHNFKKMKAKVRLILFKVLIAG